MKKILFIYALCATAVAAWGILRHKEAQRLENNQTALSEQVEHYRTRLGEEAASVRALQLRCDEFRKMREADTRRIRALGIKLRRLESTATTSVTTEVAVHTVVRDTVILHDTLRVFHWRDEWVTVDGRIGRDSVCCEVTSIVGFRNKDLVILEEEFREYSDRFFMMTDDGSYGEHGNVCVPLNRLLEAGERFDEVITIGPLIMMKFVALATKPYGVKTIASMNPVMIDGTGMCGGCRLTVGGETKFACVDGPEFDAHLIDFDEAMKRSRTYSEFEKEAREKHCNLFRQEVK